MKNGLDAGTGGHTNERDCFTDQFVTKTREMAHPAPAKVFIAQSSTTMLFFFTPWVNPPTSPWPSLSAHAEPISQGPYRK